MQSDLSRANPFVGPIPFGRDDAEVFFGRSGEIQELASLIVANRVVVLYAASGAGKTSLLNAGVLPLLERREQFEIVPAARFSRIPDGAEAHPGENVYVSSTLQCWSDALEETVPSGTTLAAFLAARPKPHDAHGRRLPRLVLFDQFEEIFTVHPEHWTHRDGFFEQLAGVLEEDRHLRLVLTLREDYLAQLEPLLALMLDVQRPDEQRAAQLAGRSHVRFRLDRLGRDAAIAAITGPVERAGRRFASGVAEDLVQDLQTLRIDVGRAEPVELPGEFVEPVQLQVVCQSLWADLPDEVEEITAAHVQTFGDVDEVLERFYAAAVEAAARAARVSDERLRRWVEASFITSLGTRGTIYRSVDTQSRFPDAAIQELENRHVVRGEWRAGTRWYELTHDRFIGPIQTSNARVAAEVSRRRRRRMRRIAALAVPVVVVGASWLAVRPTGAPAPSVALLSQAGPVELNVPFEVYLHRSNISKHGQSAHDLAQLGNLVPVTLRTQGLRGKTLVLRTRTVGSTGAPVAEQSLSARSDSNRDQRFLELWIRLPTRTGRFAYSLELFRNDQNEPLTEIRTPFFRVLGEGSSPIAQQDALIVTLRIGKRGAGTGSVVSSPTAIDCGNICLSQYAYGTRVTLIAKPGPGSRFGGWAGPRDCTASTACSVIVGPVTRVTAAFVAR